MDLFIKLLVVVTIFSGYFVALLFSNSLALLFRFVFSLLSGNLAAFLFRDIVGYLPILGSTVFPVFSVAFLLRDTVAVLLRDLVTDLVRNLLAYLLRFIIKVRNRLGSAFLKRDLLAILLRNLFTLLPWFVPALLMSIDVAAFSFSDSMAFLLIASVAFPM